MLIQSFMSGFEPTLADLHAKLKIIDQGGPFSVISDGLVFNNREGLLPAQPAGYYREYTVPTPGVAGRGARRVVTGKAGDAYFTADHDRTFQRIR